MSQNYSNHRKTVPLFHFVLLPLLLALVIGAAVNLYRAVEYQRGRLGAGLIVGLAVATVLAGLFARLFALKAQDRAIRAEENFRHYVLTGKQLDERLSTLQVVALRFAPDAEFVALAARAADQGMKPGDIKKAIKSWKPDEYRV